VQDSGSAGVWADGLWAKGSWADDVWANNLIVQLDGVARARFGDRIAVVDLADQVMVFWREWSGPDFKDAV